MTMSSSRPWSSCHFRDTEVAVGARSCRWRSSLLTTGRLIHGAIQGADAGHVHGVSEQFRRQPNAHHVVTMCPRSTTMWAGWFSGVSMPPAGPTRETSHHEKLG